MVIETTVIESKISPFIPQQFPALYQNDDPKFILFVQNYYQWLEETGNPLYYARNFPILSDVDTTTNDLLTFIKQKYFINIQLSTEANIRQIVKHCLDIYRSKGTQRCIELLFRLVFDEVVDFYYPKDDLMKASSGNWYIPKYIELSLNRNNSHLFHKKIQGLISGATAFVDVIVRTVIKKRYISLAYISAITGEFVTGEVIFPVDGSIDLADCPTMIGSLTELTVSAQGSGLGFEIGDIVAINSLFGEGASGLVTGVIDTVGELSYDFLDGGYGYSNTSQIHIANAHLLLYMNSFANTYARRYFAIYDPITQPLGEINFSNAVYTGNTLIDSPDIDPGGHVPFQAGTWVASATDGSKLAFIVNSTSTLNVVSNTYYGTIKVQIANGIVNADPFYQANITANGSIFYMAHANHTPLSNGYTDISAIGKYIGTANIVIGMAVSTNVNAFTIGETIVQHNPLYSNDPSIIASGVFQGLTSNNELIITDLFGAFRMNAPVIGLSSNNTGNTAFLILTIGVIEANNNFLKTTNTVVTCPSIGSAKLLNLFDIGDGASVGFSNNLLFPTSFQWNSDQILPLVNTRLNATTYGLSGNSSANIATQFNESLVYSTIQVGSLSNFTFAPGQGYQFAPLIYVDDKRTSWYNKFDTSIYVTNTELFLPGLQVSQAATNALGRIVSVNAISKEMKIRDYRFNDNTQFVATSNSTTTLVQEITLTTTNVVSAGANRDVPAQGRNALIKSTVATGNGSLLTMDVLYSGFGYIDGEQVWMNVGDVQTDNTAFGVTSLGKYGRGKGFYKDKNGFLSDTKKLYDGFYYQTFSYEIQSSTVFDKYEKLIKQLAHPSGTMMFGRIVHKAKANVETTIKSAVTTQGPVITTDLQSYLVKAYPLGLVSDPDSYSVSVPNTSLLVGRLLVASPPASYIANVNLTGMPIVGAQFPTMFADFTTNNYYFTGNQYGSFASWVTAIGGSFARASNASYHQAGVIKFASTDVMRFPTDINGIPTGIKLSGPGTNIWLQSNFLTTSPWTNTASAVLVANSTISPDGNNNAWSVKTTAGQASNFGYISSGGLITLAPQTLTLHVKQNDSATFAVQVLDQTAVVTLYAATVTWNGANPPTSVPTGSGTNKSFTATAMANNWWRFDCTYTAATTAGNQLRVILYPETTGAGTGKGNYFYGVQVTNSPFGLDYIPTTTANGVQVFDNFHFPFAQTAFTAFLSTTSQKTPVTGSSRLLGLNTGNAPLYLVSNTSFGLYGSALGTLAAPTMSNTVASNNKVMSAGNSSFRTITADGLTPNSSANAIVSSAPTTMDFGSDGSSSSTTGAYGHFLQFALWYNQVANTTELQNNTL